MSPQHNKLHVLTVLCGNGHCYVNGQKLQHGRGFWGKGPCRIKLHRARTWHKYAQLTNTMCTYVQAFMSQKAIGARNHYWKHWIQRFSYPPLSQTLPYLLSHLYPTYWH